MYQLIVENRQFIFYHFDSTEPELSNPRLNALSIETHKLFSNDVLDHTGDLIYSYIRSGELIPGVLILNGNRTYGKNETGKRALYKCIPDNRDLPPFLIPYELKLGFSKDIKNKYVVIKYENWDDKHPRGIITETIGDVSIMSAYYEYRLYCRNIHDSISEFTSKVRELTKDREGICKSIRSDNRFCIKSRLDVPVYSIDPEGCTDIDDAFSIQPLIGEPGYKISIYIANVYVWIERLGLWDYILNRISTIYLPDKRRTMLPTILSENLCSLLKHQSRFAFCMDVFVNPDGGVLREPEFSNVEISLHSNFAYDEPRLLSNPNCKLFMDITRKMDPTIGDTHELIEYWMIYMNSRCGERLAHAKDGIFRTATINENTTNKLKNVIRNWNDVNCKYSTYSHDADMSHQVLNIGAYVHITSPIRRLVDLLNQTMFIKNTGMSEISSVAAQFIEKWKQNTKSINDKTKSIRKTQNECELMTLPAETFEREHNGVVFGKKLLYNKMYQYSIYIENLKTFGKIKTNIDIPDYSDAKFKLYYFGDEYDSKRKLKFLIS
ncbi:MAG: ribonuclease catalytic domain-containing protein [Flavobacterium sp.]